MPELPEVETMCQKLRGWTVNANQRRIDSYLITGPRSRLLPDKEADQILGLEIQEIYRRGKVLVFDFGIDGIMTCHNAMTGYWDCAENPWTFDYVEGKRNPETGDVRLTMQVGKVKLRFHDSRKFGRIKFYKTGARGKCSIDDLGPEAIQTDCGMFVDVWNVLDLAAMTDERPIKELLMDQKCVAGIGNIYANEALWAAQIDPHRSSNKLTSEEIAAVFDSCQRVLREALANKLDYSRLMIYREKYCATCDTMVTKTTIKGRGTYYCSRCQK